MHTWLTTGQITMNFARTTRPNVPNSALYVAFGDYFINPLAPNGSASPADLAMQFWKDLYSSAVDKFTFDICAKGIT